MFSRFVQRPKSRRCRRQRTSSVQSRLLLEVLEERQLMSASSSSLLMDAGPDQVVTEGTPVQFLGQANTSTNSTLSWNFGDGTYSTYGSYGTQGYDILGGAASLPAYASVTPTGQSSWTWDSNTTDPRALQTSSSSTNRVAGCWYSPSSFSVDVNLTDGQTHNLELYLLDWDSNSRVEQVQVSDATTGAVLDTQSVSSFHSGVYLDYAVSGHVSITFTHQAGANAVLSGLFLDPTSSRSLSNRATFPKQDTSTQGNWTGTYGTQGYDVLGGAASLPAYASVTPTGQSSWTWDSNTTDSRALQTSSSSTNRVAACWYSPQLLRGREPH